MIDNQFIAGDEYPACPKCGYTGCETLHKNPLCVKVKAVYRDGVLLTKHPDAEQVQCRCLRCKNIFTYRRMKDGSLPDQPKKEEVKETQEQNKQEDEIPTMTSGFVQGDAEQDKEAQIVVITTASAELPKTKTSTTKTTTKKKTMTTAKKTIESAVE